MTLWRMEDGVWVDWDDVYELMSAVSMSLSVAFRSRPNGSRTRSGCIGLWRASVHNGRLGLG